MIEAAFLDVPKTNGLWLLFLAVFSVAVALIVRQINMRRGDPPWALGRLWGMVPLIPILFVSGIVILIGGH